MRLDPDCVRDILFCIEENSGFNKSIAIEKVCEDLNYPEDKIKYHIKQCELSGYLIGVIWYLDGFGYISDISPIGHEFVANIRSENIWKKVKEKALDVGSFSLNTLAQIAVNLISSKLC